MWIMLNDAFFSLVSKDCEPDELMVRARRKGDIEKVFSVPASRYTKSDYLYRAAVKREVIAEVMEREIDNINYDNFKDSVQDKELHDAYVGVWTAMLRVQEVPPYSGSDWSGYHVHNHNKKG